MKRWFLAMGMALLPALAAAQLSPQTPPGNGLTSSGGRLSVLYGTTAGTAAAGNDARIVGAVQSAGGNASTTTVTASGGTVARTLASLAGDTLNVMDFGAAGDCATDDTAAFNAYATYLRNLSGYQGYAREFNLPAHACFVLNGSVNLTALNGLLFNGNGSTLVGNATGKAVLDAVESQNVTFEHVKIIAQNNPKVGIQIGRPLNGWSGAGEVSMIDVYMDGAFSLAPLYDRAAETSNFIDVFLQNRTDSPTAYGVVLDGDNHFPITSDFAATYNPSNPTVADALTPDTPDSFNESVFVSGSISSYYGPAVWASNVRGLRFESSYVVGYGQAASTGGGAFDLYYGAGDSVNDLVWHVHAEGKFAEDILLTGTQTAPVINGLTYDNHIEMTPATVLALDTGVTSATIHGLRLRIPQFYNSGATVFLDPAAWSADGSAYVGAVGPWNLTTPFGMLDVAGSPSYSGGFSSAVTLPSALNVPSVQATGSVAAITVDPGASYASLLGGALPAIAISPPPNGGSQATAQINTGGFWGTETVGTGGTGYAVNDVVQLNAGCSIPIPLKVASVGTGGVVTGLGSDAAIGDCPADDFLSASVPTTNVSGSMAGSGLTVDLAANVFRVNTIAVTGAGGGYVAAPTVTIANGSLSGVTVTLGNSLSLASAGGRVLLQNNQTQLGINGSAGTPVVAEGALIDGSGVRVSLGGTYSVPANTSLVRFTQTATVSASTVTLPAALADGQAIQFDNYAGAVTALAFSPAVNGWTNGATLAAYTGLRVRWDGTASAWYREQ